MEFIFFFVFFNFVSSLSFFFLIFILSFAPPPSSEVYVICSFLVLSSLITMTVADRFVTSRSIRLMINGDRENNSGRLVCNNNNNKDMTTICGRYTGGHFERREEWLMADRTGHLSMCRDVGSRHGRNRGEREKPEQDRAGQDETRRDKRGGTLPRSRFIVPVSQDQESVSIDDGHRGPESASH